MSTSAMTVNIPLNQQNVTADRLNRLHKRCTKLLKAEQYQTGKKLSSTAEISKHSLLGDFLSTYFPEMCTKDNKCLMLAGSFCNPEFMRQLSKRNVTDLPDMLCSHEEADTRIMLPVVHTDKLFH